MGDGNEEVYNVKDNIMRWMLGITIALCTFGAKQIWEHNQLITKHTEQITAINTRVAQLETSIGQRLDRIERKQDEYFREILTRNNQNK